MGLLLVMNCMGRVLLLMKRGEVVLLRDRQTSKNHQFLLDITKLTLGLRGRNMRLGREIMMEQ